MKYRFLMLLAAAGVLAACVKEETGTSETGEKGKVVAQFGVGLSDVKTTLGPLDGTKRKIFWSEGDCIAINGVTSEPLAAEAAGESTAVFDFTEPFATPCNVLYPASMYKDESTITLQTVQTYQADGFKTNAYPMAAVSQDGKGATLSPLCAMIKLPIKLAAGTSPDTDKISSIRFMGNMSEQVSGDFTLDYSGATLSPAGMEEDDYHILLNLNKTLSTEPLPAILVVPAGTFDEGFSIRVTDVAGHYMDMSKNTSFTVEAGHLYVMPEFEFVPTGTQLGIEISSAAELIAFAQNYNSKDIAQEGLIATLTEDIVFDETTSAAFNATGGIGMKNKIFGATEDYYFNGTFNGASHKISGLTATVPLFTAVGGAGHINDLTIDQTCSFTFTHPNTTEFDAGAAVGYHKGTLKNVSVAADVSLNEGEVAQVTALGGIVGRMTEGSMDLCSYSGNLYVPYGYEVNTKMTYIGGLVGSITNANGKLLNSTFEGTIDFAATVASKDKSNPYLFLGGVVGSVSAGLVSGCEAKGTATKEIVMDNDKPYVATIQNHSRKVYHMAQGGIAGQNAGTVTECTNEASIKNFVLSNATKGGTADDDNSRYYDLGGIVGLNLADGTVSSCINKGLFESRATPRIQKIGGVVGYNKGEVISCSNTETGNIKITTTNVSPYSLRVGEVGGAIGNNSGIISDVQNAGNITMDRTENNAGVELKFGGLIGVTLTDIDGGEGKNLSNSGNVTDAYNGTTVTTEGLRFGGVVGSAQASVKNVSNSGKITFQTSAANVVSKLSIGGVAGEIRDFIGAEFIGCENTGEVYFNVTANAKHTGNYLAGIVGKLSRSPIKDDDGNIIGYKECTVAISDCVNSGKIHGGNPNKQNGTTLFVGGIIAYFDGNDGISTIEDCENRGVLLNNQFNNTVSLEGSTFQGGIAGFVQGTSENRISISNVTNNVNEGADITGPRRGYGGGAVGYGEYVDIQNATNANNYKGGSFYYQGGIAGWLVNSTVSGSLMSGTYIISSQMQNGGGIVALLGAGTTVNDCYSYLTEFSHTDTTAGAKVVAGAIAGSSVSGSLIMNCHYAESGTITNQSSGASPSSWAMTICSDGNFTDGGGNVADL